MKNFSAEALAALRSGEAIVSGAVWFGGAESVGFWGGFGPIGFDGYTFTGVGSEAMIEVTGGALGGQEQGASLTLSNVDPDVVANIELDSLRGVPVIIWRLVFNATGSQLLQASIYLRGRVDTADSNETPAGRAAITLGIETAARGLGRSLGRMRSDADQRLISATDGGLRRVTYAGSKELYFGGRPPQTIAQANGGGASRGGSQGAGGGGGGDIFDRAISRVVD